MAKWYSCSAYFAGHVAVFVEADSAEEAALKAEQEFDMLDSREIEAGIEEMEIQDVEEDCDA